MAGEAYHHQHLASPKLGKAADNNIRRVSTEKGSEGWEKG